jgi:hypothetical protein
MRSILLPVVALLALTAEYQASANQFVAASDETAAATTAVDMSSTTAQSSSNGPEQAGNLYQAKTRSAGDVSPSSGQSSDPLAGPLNSPNEPLGANRPTDRVSPVLPFSRSWASITWAWRSPALAASRKSFSAVGLSP